MGVDWNSRGFPEIMSPSVPPRETIAKASEQNSPGDQLRKLRSRLGITARQVEEFSKAIATEQGNDEFLISHGRIIQVENGESTPSIYKLCTLSAIYGVPVAELVSLFVNLEAIGRYRNSVNHDSSRLLSLEIDQPNKKMSFPVRFDPGSSVDKTGLLSRMVQMWGDIPVALLSGLNLRSHRYGLIGLADYTLYPMLKPGSIVQIDDTKRKVVGTLAPNEYQRPIYFIELRDSFVCGWCETQPNKLVIVPHPLSPVKVRIFDVKDAEVVGRVVGVAARLISDPPAQASTSGRESPPQS